MCVCVCATCNPQVDETLFFFGGGEGVRIIFKYGANVCPIESHKKGIQISEVEIRGVQNSKGCLVYCTKCTPLLKWIPAEETETVQLLNKPAFCPENYRICSIRHGATNCFIL